MNKKINYGLYSKKNLLPPAEERKLFDSVSGSNAWDVLLKAHDCWNGLHEFRKNRQRNGRFCFGDQWKDVIPDPDRWGVQITEEEAIRKQGKVPLKANLIRRITKNIVGQFRNSKTEPIAVVRNTDVLPDGTSILQIGEMMTIALQACHNINQTSELDAEMLTEYLISSVAFQRVSYGLIPGSNSDGRIENINPARMFWNPGLEDVRGWDLNFIGSIHDVTLNDILSQFAGSRAEANHIRDLYRWVTPDNMQSVVENMTSRRIENIDFFSTYDDTVCRVIEVWSRERKEMIYCHDIFKGEEYWVETNQEKYIENENRRRIAEFTANGVMPEDVPLIEYEWKIRQYWYYRFLTPRGDVLKEGESGYWHESHPYVFRFHGNFDGRTHSIVEDVIDQQKLINRMLALNDFVISSNAKNPLFVDIKSLGGMSIEQLAKDYVKVGSVIGFDLRPGTKLNEIVYSPSSNGSVPGTYELIHFMTQAIDDISGVNSAMQGKAPTAGTPAALYAQETQNAATNIVDVLESFNAFRKDRDTKLMQVISQYYDSRRYINIAGNHYSEESKYYDPQKVRNVNMIINIAQGAQSTAYRTVLDTLLMQLLQSGLISRNIFFKNTSLPFKERIQQDILAEEEQMANQSMPPADQMRQLSGNAQLPPELMKHIQENVNADALQNLQTGIMQ